MTASELESLLQSVAWQSSTLKQYFDDVSRKKAAAEPEAFEVLSDEDMLSLFADSSQGPAKKPRTADVHCDVPAQKEMSKRRPHEDDIGAASCLSEADMLALMGGFREESEVSGKTIGSAQAGPSPATGASLVSSLKRNFSVNNFDFLSMTESDSTPDEDLSCDVSSMGVALTPTLSRNSIKSLDDRAPCCSLDRPGCDEPSIGSLPSLKSSKSVDDLISMSTTRESSPQDAHPMVTKVPMHADHYLDAAAAAPVVNMV